MRTFFAFFRKEWLEQVRSGRLVLLIIIFVMFGIMNPAIAKLTPWLMETMAEGLEEAGLTVMAVTVDALTSWTQFYKNIPMALIVFVLLYSGSLSQELQKGTLIPVLTKGFQRWKAIIAKYGMQLIMWTICYWLCFLITYGYNAYFWDNSIVADIGVAAVLYWLFGILIISVMLLFSVTAASAGSVMLGCGATALVLYFAGLFPEVKKYTPYKLTEGMAILTAQTQIKEYAIPVAIAILIIVVSIGAAIGVFNRKKI